MNIHEKRIKIAELVQFNRLTVQTFLTFCNLPKLQFCRSN